MEQTQHKTENNITNCKQKLQNQQKINLTKKKLTTQTTTQQNKKKKNRKTKW